ncbi:MAG: DUF1614 domain-containing protein [Planctomycetaceae bacterium]|nr:DUF1614 domain-containing protein [Planctomycetaceae bacterium]
MHASPMHYFPVTPLFMLLLGIVLALLIALVEVGAISYAYEKMGIRRQYVFLVLLLTLAGSAINIPIAEFPAKDIAVGRVINVFGVQYVIPQIEHREKTILAINLGGALIPLALSIYLLVKNRVYVQAAIAVVVVAGVTHYMAWPVKGVGIALSPFVAPITAALVAVIISRWRAAPVAYIAGSVGTLLGADVLNLHLIQQLGAPVASIGGAGIGDGVFLAGIVAVLLA